MVSWASQRDTRTSVTMWVLTPLFMWTFTHSRLSCTLRCFTLYQLMNRQVENPLESTANWDSKCFRGRLDACTRSIRSGVNSGFDRYLQIVLKWVGSDGSRDHRVGGRERNMGCSL